jgi:hypothetical protein
MIPSSGGTICPSILPVQLARFRIGNLNVLLQKRQLGVGLNSKTNTLQFRLPKKHQQQFLQAYHYFDDSRKQ